METPVVHLTNDELVNVYEPSEDSFLLIDALELDLEEIKLKNPLMCVEIGSGSGIVITALASALEKYCTSFYLAVDINPEACRVTKKTSLSNKVNIEIIQMDLLQLIGKKNFFDLIIFNPPYVVTDSLEVSDDKLISKAWAGGHNGREVMDKIFPMIPDFLNANGSFYLLVIKENEPIKIIQFFKKLNVTGLIVAERKIRGEHLFVLRFDKK